MNIRPAPAMRRNRLFAALVLAGLTAAFPPSARAAGESDRIQELERKLERSLQRIEELAAKVHDLESTRGGDAKSTELSTSVAQQKERIEGIERQVSQLGSGAGARRADEGVPLHGFADVNFNASKRANAQGFGPKGFGIGSFDLYLTPNFGDRVKTLIETLFEVDEAGAVQTDLERLQVGYTFSDAATLWAGRIHTPYGYWNAAFHHGAQIQTSIQRPRFIDFEDKGGILPAHLVGAWLTGNVRAGQGKVNYDVYVGNGPQIGTQADGTRVMSPNAASDDNHNGMVGFNLGYNFAGAAEGLRLGLHGFRVNVDARDAAGALDSKTGVRMGGMYATYITDDWEALTEYYRFNNRTLEGALPGGETRHGSNAWFAQVGRNLGLWTPFVRFEKTSLNENDLYFRNQTSGISYSRGVLGLRYDMNATTALKLEVNKTNLNGTNFAGLVKDRFSEVRLQWAVRF